ncbi:MAG: hypothetical protein OWQ54_04470 [Sulfolobaceae archaeon]|nr:hypothetical protein [Sulfolobaceae archaeon]
MSEKGEEKINIEFCLKLLERVDRLSPLYYEDVEKCLELMKRLEEGGSKDSS